MSNAVPIRAPGQSIHRITPAELEVIRLAHLSNAEIAEALGKSRLTVKVHFRNALAKLDASNRTEAALLVERMEREAA